MSVGPYPFAKPSFETKKDPKLYTVYEQLKKKLASQKERQSPTKETTPELGDEVGEEDETEPRVVELIWEGDVEDVISLLLPQTITAEECKNSLYKDFGIPAKNVTLIKDGKRMKPGDRMKRGPEGKIIVEFVLDDYESENEMRLTSTKLSRSYSEIASSSSVPMVQVQKVLTRMPGGGKRYKEVAVVKEKIPREYLGGYRNRKTGRVYYHAKVQTMYRGCVEHNLPLTTAGPAGSYNRSTQTLLPLIDEGVNTVADKCVQMSGIGVYIPALTDKILTARPYHEYNAVHKKMTPHEAVIILQRAWRHYINMKRVHLKYKSIHDERVNKLQFKGSNQAEFHKQQLALLTKDSFPTTRSDFYDLYTILGEWTIEQRKDIASRKSGFAQKMEIGELQKKQTKGVLAIENHRIQAKQENLQKQDVMFLEGTARSRVRTYPKGNRTFIDDLNIQRARVIKEMYASYARTDVTDAERIEILISIKDCLLGFETFDLTADLIELLEREIDLITMGIKKANMEYLRKRFESLFINLAKKPEINPQAKYYKKSVASQKKYAMHRCSSCFKVFPPSHMFTHLRLGRFRICMSCSYMHSTATASINLAPYKRLLDSLRVAETEKCCRSAIPFLLQPMGMYFLVNILWDGKSIISGSSYLPGLKVTRWVPNEEWSMWNMILLTELEAYKHEKLRNPLDYYSKEFVLNVMNRNILGRIHFRMVADIDQKFRKREPVGILPKDHLLYTTKKAAAALPRNDPHPFLQPSPVNFGGQQKGAKRDVGV